MTMKFESTDSSSSSLSSSCTSDGNAMDVNHPNYKKSLIATGRNAKSRQTKSSSELEPNSSTDDDGSSSSVCNTSSSFQKEKQSPHSLVREDAAAELLVSAAGKDSAAALKPEWPPESFEKKAWSNYKQAQQQMKQLEEGATNPCMDKDMPWLLRQDQPLTLVKSNSVSATKADNILRLDYITASSSNSYHAHNNHKLQGHRLSTGDSPLHMQKRHGSQGPSASLRTGFPSPGTPSRSSFSGVPTSLMQLNSKAYYNMVGRIAVNEGNGKLLPLYSLPPCCDQDANATNPGRLSVSRAAPPPSKWDDAEKWLVNASPSHPSQPPLHPHSKQATNHITNQALNSNSHPEGKKNVSGLNKRVLNDVMVSSSPPHSQVGDHHPRYHHKLGYNLYACKDNSSFAGMSMHDSYIQSRSLVPLASSSSDGQMHEDGGGSALSDSELSNTQPDECKSAFVRSTSHRQSTDCQHKYYMKKGQPGRKSSLMSKEELAISSPVSMQLERLKLGSSTSSSLHQLEQLPKMHDVYAVETTAQLRAAGPCSDEPPGGECDVAGAAEGGASSSMTRLVVQAGKVVGRWGAGAMRDASTDVSPKMSMSRRDMGTQMTPVASSKTSRAATPRKGGSPVRHNTPTFGAHANATTAEGHVSCQGGSEFSVSTTSHEGSSSTSSWKSLQDSLLMSSSEPHMNNNNKEMQPSSALKSQDMESLQQKSHDNLAPSAQYSAWEEAERSKHMTKCAREEARIDAWESHQKAKAEAELKKLEMKLERLRAQATEKIMNKVATAHLRAEEMRAAARAQQAEQLAKALERANSLSRKGGGYFPESLGVCFSLMP